MNIEYCDKCGDSLRGGVNYGGELYLRDGGTITNLLGKRKYVDLCSVCRSKMEEHINSFFKDIRNCNRCGRPVGKSDGTITTRNNLCKNCNEYMDTISLTKKEK